MKSNGYQNGHKYCVFISQFISKVEDSIGDPFISKNLVPKKLFIEFVIDNCSNANHYQRESYQPYISNSNNYENDSSFFYFMPKSLGKVTDSIVSKIPQVTLASKLSNLPEGGIQNELKETLQNVIKAAISHVSVDNCYYCDQAIRILPPDALHLDKYA